MKRNWLLIYLIIILIPIMTFIINNNNRFKKSFCIDDYEVSENVLVADGITANEENTGQGVFLYTPQLSLDKGIYIVTINYDADQFGNSINAYSNSLNSFEMHSTLVELNPYNKEAQLTIELNRTADDITIQAVYGGKGFINIKDIKIEETNRLYGKYIFYAFVICLLIGGLSIFNKKEVSTKKIILALLGIIMASCYPIYTDYLMAGADMPFHLLRIEGIKEGLITGYFPVKIHPLWAKGYGYATGIFYGDIFLYIPALLRIIGFSIQTAYKMYVVLINAGTVCISYFCFKKIFNSRKIGVIGSFIYSLSVYRLFNLYTRTAVGEYTSMMFLPLILLGFYLIFMDENKKNCIKNSLITALGITGVIQSHLLSFEMVLFVCFVVCLVCIKKVFNLRIIYSLSLGVLITLLLNLNFIIPFLDFYNKDIYINSSEWVSNTSSTLQESGLFPIQVFSLFQYSVGGAWSTKVGVNNEASYSLGIVFLCGIALFIYLLVCHIKKCSEDENFKPACVCFIIGCLTIYMSTCYFPWDSIADKGYLINKVVNSLQFAWRMCGPSTILMSFVICYIFKVFGKIEKEQIAGFILSCCIILHTINASWYLFDFAFHADTYRVYDTYELNTMALYSNEYLPTGTDPLKIIDNNIIKDGIYVLEDYKKEGINISCYLETGENGGYIYFPLNYYKYYKCRDIETLQQFDTKAGINNMLRVEFNDKYSGTVEIYYSEPWFWRLGEILSLMTLISVICIFYRIYRQNKK